MSRTTAVPGSRALSPSLAMRHRRESLGIVVLLALSMTAFLLGIFRPFSTVTKLWIFESDVSVWSSLGTLRAEGEWFLFFVILVFTLVFPLVKMLSLGVLWLAPGLTQSRRVGLHRFVGALGKWSMLDVFIVALLVVYIKRGTLADIALRDGIVVFTVSVILTQCAAAWIGKVAERQVGE